jgi:purine-binding chemotaxis protein CheW
MQQIVVFTLGREAYCLPIEQIREIAPWTTPAPVGGAVLGVIGAHDLRGMPVAVVDLAAWLGIAGAACSAESRRIVVVEGGGTLAGLAVDAVENVVVVDEDAIESAHLHHGRHVRSVVKCGERLLVQLDADALVAAVGIGPASRLAA